jgi:hypothetical protein
MMTWEQHLAWCRQRSPEHLAGIPSARNAAGAIVVDLSGHPEFEDRMGRALRGRIIRSQGLDRPIFDGSAAEQWRMIYSLANATAIVDAVVEALNEAPLPSDVADSGRIARAGSEPLSAARAAV